MAKKNSAFMEALQNVSKGSKKNSKPAKSKGKSSKKGC